MFVMPSYFLYSSNTWVVVIAAEEIKVFDDGHEIHGRTRKNKTYNYFGCRDVQVVRSLALTWMRNKVVSPLIKGVLQILFL
jgi:hypothetical protein